MRRAEVRIVDAQQEEIKPADISRTEEEALLQKYGFGPNAQPKKQTPKHPSQEMTFEEMCQAEEQRLKEEKQREIQRRVGPKPASFGGDYNSRTTFSSEDGVSFKVNIVSNMDLPDN